MIRYRVVWSNTTTTGGTLTPLIEVYNGSGDREVTLSLQGHGHSRPIEPFTWETFNYFGAYHISENGAGYVELSFRVWDSDDDGHTGHLCRTTQRILYYFG